MPREIWPVWTCDRSAKIIDHALFLRTNFHLVDFTGDAFRLRRALDNEWLDICRHVGSQREARGRSPRPWWVTDTFSLAKGFKSPPLANGLTGASPPPFTVGRTRGSCVWCQTDFTMGVEWRDDDECYGFAITVTAYHRLGTGRSPADPAWTTFSSSSVLSDCIVDPTIFSWRAKTAFPAGSVERAWLRAEEEGE